VRKDVHPMKILIATDVPRQKEAGTAGVVLNNASELRKRGHEVDCWFLDDVRNQKERLGHFASLVFAFRVARRILRDRKKYDVVNLHGYSGCVYGVWRKITKSKDSPPYVFTIQGIVERYAHVMRREHRKGRAWHFGWKNRAWHRFYHQNLFTVAIRTADYGAASNREAWTYPELVHDRDPGRIWYVPNGVEEQFFIKRRYEVTTPLRLLFVGTWLDRKGIYYLVDALQILVKKGEAVQLTVAGCLSSEIEVKPFFAPEVQKCVQVLPFVEREKMPRLYAEHDIFVFPSLMEGMPLALLEAMAAGMPVVSTYNSGMADVLEDRFNGLAVADADAQGLADAVEELSNSAELRKQLGEEAARTMRRYTWERVTGQLEKVLFLAATREAHK
jgi:glycosyltransferase involved in cell wall biosynthesis